MVPDSFVVVELSCSLDEPLVRPAVVDCLDSVERLHVEMVDGENPLSLWFGVLLEGRASYVSWVETC